MFGVDEYETDDIFDLLGPAGPPEAAPPASNLSSDLPGPGPLSEYRNEMIAAPRFDPSDSSSTVSMPLRPSDVQTNADAVPEVPFVASDPIAAFGPAALDPELQLDYAGK